jgi:hypothetical protein
LNKHFFISLFRAYLNAPAVLTVHAWPSQTFRGKVKQQSVFLIL